MYTVNSTHTNAPLSTSLNTQALGTPTPKLAHPLKTLHRTLSNPELGSDIQTARIRRHSDNDICLLTAPASINTRLKDIEALYDFEMNTTVNDPEMDDWLYDDLGDFAHAENAIITIGNIGAINPKMPVKTLELLGSYMAESHQELLITLKDDTPIRISRNNGTDTFQIGLSHNGGKELPTLKSFDLQNSSINFGQIQQLFYETHNSIKRYDQGNCQVFSQMMCESLIPGSFPSDIDW